MQAQEDERDVQPEQGQPTHPAERFTGFDEAPRPP